MVRYGDRLGDIPGLIFLAGLVSLELLIVGFQLRLALVLWFFTILDWMILASLGRLRISYGPANPTALILGLLRSLAMAVAPQWWPFVQPLGTILVVYGFVIEPQRLVVRLQSLNTGKLAIERPLRVLHFGDLHVEGDPRILNKLVEAVNGMKPDLILFTGDILSYSAVEDPYSRNVACRLLTMLESKHGFYAVPGSPPVDRADVLDSIYSQSPVNLIQDGHASIEVDGQRIDLIGITCTHKPHIDGPRLERVLTEVDGSLRILLYHSPDLAPFAATLDIDLQLSGHTHGGQVRLPLVGALYTSSLYGKRFESGRYQLDGMALYTTRGIGMEGAGAPRVRFLCPPEVTLWEIT